MDFVIIINAQYCMLGPLTAEQRKYYKKWLSQVHMLNSYTQMYRVDIHPFILFPLFI